MSTRPPKPEGCSWMSPYFVVRDVRAAAKFYADAFGFHHDFTMDMPNGQGGHTEMTYRDIKIMLSPEGDCENGPMKSPASLGHASPMNMYVYVEDVDAAFKRAVDAGAKPDFEPQDMFWGDRIACLTDPDGYQWTLGQNVGEFDESKAKEFYEQMAGQG